MNVETHVCFDYKAKMMEMLRKNDQTIREQTCTKDPATVIALLKGCARKKNLKKGIRIHADLVKEGLLSNTYVCNTLICMYARCGAMEKAQEVFDKLPSQETGSWNSLISGYAYCGYADDALDVYKKMQKDGFSPDAATFICVLKACGSIRALNKGEEIHGEIVRGGWLDKQVMVGTTLVDMYAKCGAISRAREAFDELPFWDVVSWNALIAGYAQNGCGEEALICYQEMQWQGVSPTPTTFVCLLKACGNTGSAEIGQEIHAEIKREGLVKINALVGTALIDMYVRCGTLRKAQEVFDELPLHDSVAWNTLLAGYAQVGECDMVTDLFRKMLIEGIGPNFFTFTILLNACNHSGLLQRGQIYFDIMKESYGVVPTLKHFTCMIDLFCRAGSFDKSIMVIKSMPFCADLTVWLTLLGACRKWGNVDLGLLAFQNAVKKDEKDASAYLLMGSIYTSAGMLEHAKNIETMRVRKQAWKMADQCLCDEDWGKRKSCL